MIDASYIDAQRVEILGMLTLFFFFKYSENYFDFKILIEQNFFWNAFVNLFFATI
jgi:hypothetical protein